MPSASCSTKTKATEEERSAEQLTMVLSWLADAGRLQIAGRLLEHGLRGPQALAEQTELLFGRPELAISRSGRLNACQPPPKRGSNRFSSLSLSQDSNGQFQCKGLPASNMALRVLERKVLNSFPGRHLISTAQHAQQAVLRLSLDFTFHRRAADCDTVSDATRAPGSWSSCRQPRS